MRLRLALLAFVAVSSLTLSGWPAHADVTPPSPCASTDDGGEACSDNIASGECVELSGKPTCRTKCQTAFAPCCGAGLDTCRVSPATSACQNTFDTTACGVGPGLCLSEGDALHCVPADTPCNGLSAGAACIFENGTKGSCGVDPVVADAGFSGLVCRASPGSDAGKGGCSVGRLSALDLAPFGLVAAGAALLAASRRRRARSGAGGRGP